jgi:hypothetical protein
MEMKILVEEWLKRIGRFRLSAGFEPEFRAGFVMSLKHVPVEWDPPGAARSPAQAA